MTARARATAFFDKMLAKFGEHRMEQVSRSWSLVSREECKLRLRTVMSLSVELDRIKRENIFSTGLGESCIEDVIMGNWRAASDFASYFTFKDQPDIQGEIVRLWIPFVVVLRAACSEAESIARFETKVGEPS